MKSLWFFVHTVLASNSTLLTFSLESKLTAPQVVGKTDAEYVSHSTFIGSFEIGTPPQKVPLIVDLISDVFWIVGNDATCTYPPCDTQFSFDYSMSTSYVSPNDNKGFEITNPLPVQSIVKCGNSFDTLTIGNLSVPSVPVCVAYDFQSEFSFSAGRIGLSPNGGILSTLNGTNQISPIASVWFNQTVYDPNYSQFGYVTLGGIDPTLLVDGTIKWISLSRPKDVKWYLNVTGIQYDTMEYTESFEMSLDLNEPLSYVPADVFDEIIHLNPSIKKTNNYYIVENCRNSSISPIVLSFGETTVELSPKQMVYPINGVCLFAFAPVAANRTTGTLGYYILQNFYTILDYGNSQVGFGQSSGLNAAITEISYGNQLLPIATMSIGTPPQDIRMLLQTESNITWVRYSSDRCTPQSPASGKSFSPANSSSFVNQTPVDKNGNEAVVQLDLINGTVDIERIMETVKFGRLSFPNSTLGGGCSFDGSSPDLFQYSSGSLGLAPGNSDIHKLLGGGNVEPVMSLWYNRTATDGPAGELIIGGVDNSKYIEPIVWVPSEKTDSWIFTVDVYLGDEKIASNQQASPYSGATLISVPTDLFNQITKNMDLEFVSNQYIFKSCLDTINLKPMEFVINNSRLTLKHDQQYYFNPPSCILNFAPWNGTSIVLGSLFLRHFYMAMNYGNSSIGFATPSDNFTIEFQGNGRSPFSHVILVLPLLLSLLN